MTFAGSCSIPVIDFEPFLMEEGIVVGDIPTDAQLRIAAVIDASCRDHGFVYLSNFFRPTTVRETLFSAAQGLFEQDETTKNDLMNRISYDTNLGYAPYKFEYSYKFANDGRRTRVEDLKEAFNVRFPPAHRNDFTGCPEEFVSAAETCLDDFRVAAERYGMACALALGLPVDFFTSRMSLMNQSTLRFLHYPPCETEFLEKTATASDPTNDVNGSVKDDGPLIRIGEHTDFGVFTFLIVGEDGPDGLQLKSVEGGEANEAGEWRDVAVPSGGGVIVNTGALMARWTNDHWKATAHRVVVQSAAQARRHRYSIACFIDPDATTVVSVHPKFHVDGKCDYEDITARDYHLMRLKEEIPDDEIPTVIA